jgi:prephenate dehydrogenase
MERIAIIGLGLIGGSLGLALKRAKVAEIEIVGLARHAETAQKALALGAIDKAETELSSAVKDAHLVIIATPLMVIKDVLQQLADCLPSGCIVTDTGSTKVQVIAWAQALLPSRIDFIGGHPMTGKETSGLGHAEAGLFQGCVYCLSETPNTSPEAIQLVIRLVELIGAKPLLITPAEHDRLVAAVSHLPMLLSAALVSATTNSPTWTQMSQLAASGYRDLSRLASGNPEMSRDICLTNKVNLLTWVGQYIEELSKYRHLIAEGSDELMQAFIQAQQARQRWLQEHAAKG